MNIYTSVIGQILRHFLTGLAVLLAAYGVTADMQSELVETTITIVVPIAMAIVAQFWGYAAKRYLPDLLSAAYEADPNEVSLATVVDDVKSQRRGSGGIASLFSLVLICSVFFTGCPSGEKTTIREFKEASAKMSVHGQKIIQANIDAFKAKEITAGQLADLNSVTRQFTNAVKVYREAIKVAERTIAAGEETVNGAAQRLRVVFTSVQQAYLNLSNSIKGFPGANSEKAQAILAGIDLSISIITALFSQVEREIGGQTA